MAARIFTLVDAYDAMTSERPYRPAASHEQAMEEIIRCAGTQFDPELVRVFRALERNCLVSQSPARLAGDDPQIENPRMAA